MHTAINNCMVHHFADDTNLLFSHKNPKIIKKVVNEDLKLLFQWLCSNRLSLNVGKTEFILFRPPRVKFESRIFLTLNRNKIFASYKIKYLGLILDDRLTWKEHISELSKKLSRSVGMIFKVRDFCSKAVMRSIYFSIFNSHLSYGLPIWGNADKIHLEKIVLLQKKAIRAITFSDFNAHTFPLLKELGILSVSDSYQYQLSSLMWDLDHNMLPSSLSSHFRKRKNDHHHLTRMATANKFSIKKSNTKRYGLNSFHVQGSLTLNKLKDLDIYNNSGTKNIFLKRLKHTFLEAY